MSTDHGLASCFLVPAGVGRCRQQVWLVPAGVTQQSLHCKHTSVCDRAFRAVSLDSPADKCPPGEGASLPPAAPAHSDCLLHICSACCFFTDSFERLCNCCMSVGEEVRKPPATIPPRLLLLLPHTSSHKQEVGGSGGSGRGQLLSAAGHRAAVETGESDQSR